MMKKSTTLVLLVLALALGVFLGVCYATGSLPNSDVNLAHQAKTMQQWGELSWYIQSFNYEQADREALYVGGARGMVAALNDTYAAYYTGREFEQLMQSQSGRYTGIGISIEFAENDDVLIASVTEGSPAERAGLQEGDIIRAIDGEPIAGWTLEQLTETIHGKGEETFQMGIEREGIGREVSLTNEEIVSHRVHYSATEGMLHLRMDSFMGDAVEGFDEAIAYAKREGLAGVVLDLRDNPGGDLEIVLDIADRMMDGGIIMTMKSRSGQETVYKAEAGTTVDLPVVVLINGSSASASEVLAGALQDHHIARILGTTSFGKGIVQSIYPLRLSDGHVKLTTAAYYTPDGRSLHGTGVEPDEVVELPEAYKDDLAADIPTDADTQLQAALRALAGDWNVAA